MKAHDQALDTAILALVIGAGDPARLSRDYPQPPQERGDASGQPAADGETPAQHSPAQR
jgi:hypothetical protein